MHLTPLTICLHPYKFLNSAGLIHAFSLFFPSPTTPEKRKLICGKATDVPFHRECAGKDVWNAAPQILQSLSPVRPGLSSSFQAAFVPQKAESLFVLW